MFSHWKKKCLMLRKKVGISSVKLEMNKKYFQNVGQDYHADCMGRCQPNIPPPLKCNKSQENRQKLPIMGHRSSILDLISKNQVGKNALSSSLNIKFMNIALTSGCYDLWRYRIRKNNANSSIHFGTF